MLPSSTASTKKLFLQNICVMWWSKGCTLKTWHRLKERRPLKPCGFWCRLYLFSVQVGCRPTIQCIPFLGWLYLFLSLDRAYKPTIGKISSCLSAETIKTWEFFKHQPQRRGQKKYFEARAVNMLSENKSSINQTECYRILWTIGTVQGYLSAASVPSSKNCFF
jgi:hypothetical protein